MVLLTFQGLADPDSWPIGAHAKLPMDTHTDNMHMLEIGHNHVNFSHTQQMCVNRTLPQMTITHLRISYVHVVGEYVGILYICMHVSTMYV